MGNHSKLSRFSTNTSTRTEPSAGDKATGFVANEQPVAKDVNWLIGETIDKVNDVIEDQTISGFAVDEGMAPIIQRYLPDGGDASWSQPFDDVNVISHGTSLAWVDMCAHVTTAGVREILALDGNSSCQVTRFDALTGALNGVSGDLSTGNLPAGGGQDWIPCAMCSDGTSVYITFKDFNVTPNETHQIQAFDIATWTRKSGWPATGTTLLGTGTCTDASCHGDVEIVTATQIAVTNSWVTAGGVGCLSVIGMADGVIDVSGDGDGTSQPKYMTSDGTNIYFTNTSFDVHSADIATLAGGAGGGIPYAGTGTGLVMDVLYDGSRLHSTWQESGPSVILRSFIGGTTYIGACGSGDNEIFLAGGKMAWDGFCLWIRGTVERTSGASKPRDAIARIDTGLLCYEDNVSPIAQPDLENFIKTVVILDHDVLSSGPNHDNAPIIFDGRDIWAAGDMLDLAGGGTLSGKIYRIPKALLR